MAQPTTQDLVDALDRLAKALAAAQPRQAAAAPAGPGIPFVGNPAPAAPTAPTDDPHKASKKGGVQGRVSRLAQAYRAFKSARTAWQTVGKVRGLMRQGRFKAAFKAGGRGLGQAFRGIAGPGRAAAGAAEAAGGAAGAAGVAGMFVGILMAEVEAFILLKRHVEQTTEALIQAQQRLAEFSPSMAAVMARRQVLEISRDVRKGEALAASANDLVEAEQRRKDANLPFEILQERIQNWLYTQGNDFIAGAMKSLADTLGLDNKQQAQTDFLDQLQKDVDRQMAVKEAARKRMGDLERKAAGLGRKRVHVTGEQRF